MLTYKCNQCFSKDPCILSYNNIEGCDQDTPINCTHDGDMRAVWEMDKNEIRSDNPCDYCEYKKDYRCDEICGCFENFKGLKLSKRTN